MARSFDKISLILRQVRDEGGVDFESKAGDSVFCQESCSFLPSEGEAGAIAKKLAVAMEALLIRNQVDNRLLVALCTACNEMSELPLAKLLKCIDKALPSLRVPTGSWVSKNIRAARVIEAHPSLAAIVDVEALSALDKLPEGSLQSTGGTGQFLVGEELLEIHTASRKEVLSAVRKAKSDFSKEKKKRGEETPASPSSAELDARDDNSVPWQLEDSSEETEGLEGESLESELSQAEVVISRLLTSLPREERHEQLTSALEMTRTLLAYARADFQTLMPREGEIRSAEESH